MEANTVKILIKVGYVLSLYEAAKIQYGSEMVKDYIQAVISVAKQKRNAHSLGLKFHF
jgi:hypothetical protein